MTEKSPGSDTNPTDRSRRGCSCWTQIMFAVLILFCLIVLGFLYWSANLREQAYSGLTPAEIAQFEKWANSPLNLTAEQLKLPTPLPEDVVRERTSIIRDAQVTSLTIENLFSASDPLHNRLLTGKPLTPYEIDVVTSAVTENRALVARARTLVNKDYALSRKNFPEQLLDVRALSRLAKFELLHGAAEALAGNPEGELAAIDLALRLVAYDPLSHVGVRESALEVFSDAVQMIRTLASRTTSVLTLESAYKLLADHRRPVLQMAEETMIPRSSVYLHLQMRADGFVHTGVMTPRSLTPDFFTYRDYYKHLLETLPPGSPRFRSVQEKELELRLMISREPKWVKGLFRIVQIGPGKILGRQILRTGKVFSLVHEWKRLRSNASEAKHFLAYYDLTMAAIARRIAALTGKDIKEILHTIPVDRFSSAPLLHDAAKDR